MIGENGQASMELWGWGLMSVEYFLCCKSKVQRSQSLRRGIA